MTDGRYVLSIDLDGVLTNGEPFWETRPTPNKPMIKAVRKLYYSCKYVIIIWTARRWIDAPKTVGWLIENNVPFHGLYMEKMGSDAYIDDKAFSPTVDQLEKFLDEPPDIPACGHQRV